MHVVSLAFQYHPACTDVYCTIHRIGSPFQQYNTAMPVRIGRQGRHLVYSVLNLAAVVHTRERRHRHRHRIIRNGFVAMVVSYPAEIRYHIALLIRMINQLT